MKIFKHTENKLSTAFILILHLTFSFVGIFGLILLVPSILGILNSNIDKMPIEALREHMLTAAKNLGLEAHHFMLLSALLCITIKNVSFFFLEMHIIKQTKEYVFQLKEILINNIFQANILTTLSKSPVKLSRLIAQDMGKCTVYIISKIKIIAIALQITIYLLAALYIAPVISTLALGIFSVFGVFRKFLVRKMKKHSKTVLHEGRNMQSFFVQFLNAITLLKISNKTKKTSSLLLKKVRSIDDSANSALFLQSSLPYFTEFFGILSLVILMFVSTSILNINIEASRLFTVLLIILRCVPLINQLLANLLRAQESAESIHILNKYLNIFKENKTEKNSSSKTKIDHIHEIKISNLKYFYEQQKKPALNIKSLVLKKESYIVLGKSGSGKSTFINLLTLLLKPENNSLKINNVDFSKISLSSYRKKIAYMGQKSFVFSDSIFNNIQFFLDRPLEEKELMDAFKSVGLEKKILSLKEGLHHSIDAQGSSFSGGELQRLALARVFLKNPEIIILDEVTSSLDEFTERTVVEKILTLFKGKIVIFVSHNQSLSASFDNILEVCDGHLSPPKKISLNNLRNKKLSI